MKTLGLMIIFGALASSAFAGEAAVPEIDASFAASAVALVGGGMLILRGRKR